MSKIQIHDGGLPGIKIIQPRVVEDERGYFFEGWNQAEFREAGLDLNFVQQNHSRSRRGVIRGLHFQQEPWAQGKLVWASHGSVWDVLVDLRPDSPRRFAWWACTLSDQNHQALWIPPGFAHGFQVLTDWADFSYSVTSPWVPQAEGGISWSDRDLDIPWPLKELAIISARDRSLPPLWELQ